MSSAHGPECIMPLVQSVDVSFPVSQPQAELPSCGTDLQPGLFQAVGSAVPSLNQGIQYI